MPPGASVGIVAVYAALSPDSFAVFLFGLRYTLDVSGVVGMTLLLWKLGNSVNDYGVIGGKCAKQLHSSKILHSLAMCPILAFDFFATP